MNVVDFSLRLDTRYTLWSGLHRRAVRAARLLRHRPVAGAALSGRRAVTESRLGPAVQRPAQGPDAVLHPLRRGDGVRLLPVHPAAAVLQPGGAGAGAGQPRRPSSRRWRRSTPGSSPRSAGRIDAWLAQPGRGGAALRDAEARMQALPQGRRRAGGPGPAGGGPKDADYIFLRFVLDHFPRGLVGLLLAVILCAAMSATAARLTRSARPRVVDFYRPLRTRCHRRALPARWRSGPPSVWGVVAVVLRRLRLAARQPDPGGQHPRLALLRADARRVPGGLLPRARGGARRLLGDGGRRDRRARCSGLREPRLPLVQRARLRAWWSGSPPCYSASGPVRHRSDTGEPP